MRDIKGKNILFIAPKFYGYEKHIVNILENNGANVFYYEERPTFCIYRFLHLVQKININVNWIYKIFLKNLYNKISCRKYELFILIKGEIIDPWFVNEVKQNLNINGKCVYYTWDSLANNLNTKKIFGLFDEAYTFDRIDSLNNFGIKFLPLFYINSYSLGNKSDRKIFDISMIASFQITRYKIVSFFINSQLNCFFKLYYPFINFIKFYISDVNIRNNFWRYIIFHPMPDSDIVNIYSLSKAVLDVQHYFQSGLTMRTIECMANRTKLVTTNKDIVNYDFYKSKNIFILDLNHLVLPPKDWLNSDFDDIDQGVLLKYSLENWLQTLIS